MLKAALNGGRTRAEHPTVPVTPHELAAAARSAVQAGADALHLHPRDDGEAETLDAGAVQAALEAVQAACPGVPVGISSAYRIRPDVAGQVTAARSWTTRPDFVSVNWHEPHATALAETLLELEVGVEAGLWTPAATRAFLAWPARGRVLRVLLELPDRPAPDVIADLDAMQALLRDAALTVPAVLHGDGQSAWAMIRESGRRGLHTRVGLEDTLVRPDGTPARDNADLVFRAREVLAYDR